MILNPYCSKVQCDPFVDRKDGVIVMVHDHVVAGPISAVNKPLAKGLVAEAAMKALKDENSEFTLRKICQCMHEEDEEDPGDLQPDHDMREKDFNIETTEGFVRAGQVRLAEVKTTDDAQEDDEFYVEDEDELDSEEVERLLSSPPFDDYEG